MTDEELIELAQACGVVIYRRVDGQRCWHDRHIPSLLDVMRAAYSAGVRAAQHGMDDALDRAQQQNRETP